MDPGATTDRAAPAPEVRYRAFVSYSHRDRRVAAWLHHAIETYHIPAKLVGLATRVGPVPRRLTPVFRDRDELPASGDLSAELTAALRDSAFLVVICSPAAAASRWVGEEIAAFKRFHGDDRVLALIAEGEPYASAIRGREAEECLPRALRFKAGADGGLSDIPAEPIAADIRATGDGRRAAKLKIVAGLTGLKLDALVQRETQRRMRRLVILATASAAGMVFAGGLALYANQRRIEANEQRRIAEKESATARATADYLVGTFELANPATENPRTITALSILARSAERARTELAGQPAVESRLVDTIGRAYNNLGLIEESRTALERAKPMLIASGPDGAPGLLTLGMSYLWAGRFDQAMANVALADRVLGGKADSHPEVRALEADLTGQVMIAKGASRRGLAAYDRAVRYCAASTQISPQTCAKILNNRGFLLSDLGRYDEAERSLLAANATYRRALGPYHRLTGQSDVALAQNAFLAGRLPLAEQRINLALGVLRRVLDPDSLILADALSMQGQIFQGEGKLKQARDSLEQAIAAYRKRFGGYHYLIGIAEVYLALVESDLGHTDIALTDIAEAKRNYDASYGKLHPNHGDLLVNRAKILARVGRLREARADCASGLSILAQTLGADADYTKTMAKTCATMGA